jgi:hypothetical protein
MTLASVIAPVNKMKRLVPKLVEEVEERACRARTAVPTLQTAERGDADLLCSDDGDFHDAATIAFCAARDIAASKPAREMGCKLR